MDNTDFENIQGIIGYSFNNRDLLQQAFIRRSYSKENGGENNEVLEFIGDSVLNLVTTKLLTEEYGYFISECNDYNANEDFNEFASDYQEDKLTTIKKKLVEKTTLANCIDNLGLADYLIMGKGDRKNNIQRSASVKEDLFEAIIGAIALDSKWDIVALQDSIEIMLNPTKLINTEDINYVSEIQEWTLRNYGELPSQKFVSLPVPYYKTPYEMMFHNIDAMYAFTGISNKTRGVAEINDKFSCEIQLGDLEHRFIGYGKSKSDARSEACKLAYSYLEDKQLLFTIYDEIENPSFYMSINQLETLARRGYFSIPTYTFHEYHDDKGNPMWKCKCHIKEKDYFYWSKSKSKKTAKKEAAYEMLKHILDLEDD